MQFFRREPASPLVQPLSAQSESPKAWLSVSILAGLVLVETLREGGFWRADALVVAVASFLILVIQVIVEPQSRRSWAVVGSLFLLALWWFVRAFTSGAVASFFPLGASILGFLAAFIVVQSLESRQKQAVGLGVASLGAGAALVGFAGLIWRWYPMAMPAQHLWRLSTTLTYSDAAGLLLAMCLLIALAGGARPWLSRVAVCLCAGGLVATQSRGAFVAFLCACLLVPLRQYGLYVAPLLAGIALGVVAVATSPSTGHVPWLAVALVAAIAVSIARVPGLDGMAVPRRAMLIFGAAIVVALIGSIALLHSEIALRALAPSDQDRAVEWSAAFHQFESSPFIGVGPDRLLQFHATDGTYAHFAHNEYLQITADGGLVGLFLLAIALAALVRVVRRVDTLTSCAVASLVSLAVGGAFDFDWHLPVIGLLGGCLVGLAAMTPATRAGVVHRGS
ncbi:MAG TPA: O-antigen ligase family protein [Acidimicrobiales bacterium]